MEVDFIYRIINNMENDVGQTTYGYSEISDTSAGRDASRIIKMLSLLVHQTLYNK